MDRSSEGRREGREGRGREREGERGREIEVEGWRGSMWYEKMHCDVIMDHMLLTLASSHPLDAYPPEEEHRGVVVDVQERHLAVFLAKNEKHLVGKGHQV